MSDLSQRSKIKGKKVVKFNGLVIYASLKLPRRRGKARIHFRIQQEGGYDWRVEQLLSYGHSVDIRFATDTARNSKGQIV